MQGLHDFIATEDKIRFINSLLQVGFDTIDFGSFVSPKAIPQMADTAKVLEGLDLSETDTKLLAIIANRRGAIQALEFDQIEHLGYPFSISESFQLRNTNATIEESLERVKQIQDLCVAKDKKLVIYISMGFGNPYGDVWNVEIVNKWVNTLTALEIPIFQLSDTIGVARPETIEHLFSNLIPEHPNVEIGAHFHTTPDTWEEKVLSAWENGCRRFDGTIGGLGGCPMAQNKLVGNMPSEQLIWFATERSIPINLNLEKYGECRRIASQIML